MEILANRAMPVDLARLGPAGAARFAQRARTAESRGLRSRLSRSATTLPYHASQRFPWCVGNDVLERQQRAQQMDIGLHGL